MSQTGLPQYFLLVSDNVCIDPLTQNSQGRSSHTLRYSWFNSDGSMIAAPILTDENKAGSVKLRSHYKIHRNKVNTFETGDF
jgi:hypothetical protein